MVTLGSILCPVDFSEQSRHALRCAGALARRSRGRVIVLSAVDPLLAEAAKVRFGLVLAQTETEPALREFVAATWLDDTARPDVAKFDVRVGEASEVILEAAARESPDLIVMGTHGLGGVRKWLLGSTTERVLRRTRIPVLAVPSATGHSVGDSPFEPGPILAATDFGGASARAVRWAADLAREMTSPLLLVHVVEPIVVLPQWQPFVEQADEARAAEARVRLETLAKPFAGSVECEIVVVLGRPADSIAAMAAERGAGAIVIGLAGGDWRPGSRPGSIAYRVLCVAKVPVVVVPPEP